MENKEVVKNDVNSKKWKVSDFVLIGILAAVYGAVTLGIGMSTASINPMLHMFSASIVALILGTVVLFVVKKVDKPGVLALFISISIAMFAGFSGMFYLPFVGTVVITSIIVDMILRKSNYKTSYLAIGYGVIQSAYIFGGCIPVLFFLDQNIKKWQDAGMSMEMIQGFVKHSSGWYLVMTMSAAFVAGIIGINIGKAILKKHFDHI